MGTLSKALGSCGGYVAGSAALVSYLKLAAPGFVYSVGMPPASAAAALAALDLVSEERVAELRRKSAFFLEQVRATGCNTGSCEGTPIVPVLFPSVEETMRTTASLHQQGIHVLPILYPAVDESSTRLRFFVTCLHTEDDLRRAAAALGINKLVTS
jgi:8-amino-7-oxononanoate synthase